MTAQKNVCYIYVMTAGNQRAACSIALATHVVKVLTLKLSNFDLCDAYSVNWSI